MVALPSPPHGYSVTKPPFRCDELQAAKLNALPYYGDEFTERTRQESTSSDPTFTLPSNPDIGETTFQSFLTVPKPGSTLRRSRISINQPIGLSQLYVNPYSFAQRYIVAVDPTPHIAATFLYEWLLIILYNSSFEGLTYFRESGLAPCVLGRGLLELPNGSIPKSL